MLGKGISMSTVVTSILLGTTAIVGLSVGLGIENNKSALRDSELDDLKRQIKIVEDITKDINVRPPNGFIN
ncbi:hypothetical protein [Candidatus Arthromitus sp. SFB-rat-Yit]|uniref:hypothetical protein n=1 Tax=Candidatus Arthromitus sp. SFB-rat-Yit TaxID=1041504 RepID=UPI0002FEE50C|nr:hypothetical protein [Candidatus Arthromitus sp. SFB-rat-Yit]